MKDIDRAPFDAVGMGFLFDSPEEASTTLAFVPLELSASDVLKQISADIGNDEVLLSIMAMSGGRYCSEP